MRSDLNACTNDLSLRKDIMYDCHERIEDRHKNAQSKAKESNGNEPEANEKHDSNNTINHTHDAKEKNISNRIPVPLMPILNFLSLKT